MFSRSITNGSIRMSLGIPQFAEELFLLIERNREYLGQWLPWLDGVRCADDTRNFIIGELEKFARGEALYTVIFVHDRIAGAIAFNAIDCASRTGEIGYWLGEEFTGVGIMTRAVKELISMGKDYYQLEKVIIDCAEENWKSRALAERLHFRQGKTAPHTKCINSRRLDYVSYALKL